MNDFKEILITGLILLVYFIFSGKKKKRQKEKPIPGPVYEGADENWQPEESAQPQFTPPPIQVHLEENFGNYPKNEEYFTYETIESEEKAYYTKNSLQREKEVENEMQVIENEGINNLDLSFSQDELIKGVIYAEILKNPYN